MDVDAVHAVASELRGQLAVAPLSLDLPGVDQARTIAADGVRQLDDYVLPRLANLDAPALAVVGGSTGAGKSTLVNSLLRSNVTRPGVLRPTTRAPVLVCRPEDIDWFDDDRVLPGLARVSGEAHGTAEISLATSPALPPRLALVDAPDIDSVVDSNRAMASQLLDAADLWVFVTTASRYADAVPWEFLQRAAQRGVVLGIVVNRLPPAAGEVVDHLREMLAEHGLDGTPVFAVDEQPLTDEWIADDAVRPLRNWLGALVDDQASRAEIVRRTLTGTVADLAVRADSVAVAVESQHEALAHLGTIAHETFDTAHERLIAEVGEGAVMRGEVLARWQDVVGTGELLRQLQSTIGRWRDRVASALTGRTTGTERLQDAIEHSVDVLVRAHAATAAERVAASWRAHPAGAALVAAAPEPLDRPSPQLSEGTERLVRDWQGSLLEMLRVEGASKRTTAKALSYGVNGVGLVAMVGVFAHTGGLTGAEVAIAGGTSVAGQKVLEAVLGDQAVRSLSLRARDDLYVRTGELFAAEVRRYLELLETVPGTAHDAAAALRDTAARLAQLVRR